MRIVVLDNTNEKDYDEFLKESPYPLFFASSAYKNLLSRFLNAEPNYLLAVNDIGKIVGSLPLIKCDSNWGTVFNSLPFYGSNGGVMSFGDNNVVNQLLRHYKELLGGEKVVSGTIVSSPFEPENEMYEKQLDVRFKDSRIGQVTIFGNVNEESLMDIFHYKTRNAIRKGIKSRVTVRWECGLDYLDFLSDVHQENMSKINVAFKPKSFFDLLPVLFNYGKQYRIYVAFHNNNPIAALLVFYFNRTVEYFTPATIEQYRELQPMNVIIYEAMKDAVSDGFLHWNWGGTSINQKGVYDFKKKWGTQDLPYYYYTTICDEKVFQLSKETLLKEFPFFYVAPFNALQ